MAGNLSDYLETVYLNWLRGTATTPPSTLYLALFTVAPTDAGGGTEVTGGAYARQVVTFGAPSGGQIVSSADVVFPEAAANWGTVVACAVFDAATAGNQLAQGPLASSATINTGTVYKLLAGQVTLNLD
jgi:hypothetical protein